LANLTRRVALGVAAAIAAMPKAFDVTALRRADFERYSES
jgi:hypothetical protein